MLQLRLFGIPLVIEPWFWISAVLLGGGFNARGPEDWKRIAVWTAVLLVSVLAHELGHAIMGARFGARPAIKLHGFGGLTYLPGANFGRRQSILVSAAGPMAGFMLGLVIFLLGKVFSVPRGLVSFAFAQALYINVVWTCLNLLPIQPLDGGQILREILGPGRLRVTALIGGVLSVALCVWSLQSGRLYLALLFALFAFQNFRQQPLEGGVIKG